MTSNVAVAAPSKASKVDENMVDKYQTTSINPIALNMVVCIATIYCARRTHSSVKVRMVAIGSPKNVNLTKIYYTQEKCKDRKKRRLFSLKQALDTFFHFLKRQRAPFVKDTVTVHIVKDRLRHRKSISRFVESVTIIE